jgi:hypothetical protein
MSGTPLTGLVAWNTPNVYSTGGTYLSSDVNIVAKNVALAYAKPFATINATNAATSIPSGTTVLFQTSGTYNMSPAFTVNATTAAPGNITFSGGTSATFSVPIAGTYRIHAQLQVAGVGAAYASDIFELACLSSGSSGTNNYQCISGYTNPLQSNNSSISIDFLLQMVPTSTPSPTYPTSIYFEALTNAAMSVIGLAGQYRTFATIEYVGSLGGY